MTSRLPMKSVDLTVRLAGLRLKNPVIAASGTYGYGTEYQRLAPASDFGAIITKTVTLAPRAGNPPPRLCETPSGMLNAIGLANVGIDAFLRDKLPPLRRAGTVVIANIAGNTVAGWTRRRALRPLRSTSPVPTSGTAAWPSALTRVWPQP